MSIGASLHVPQTLLQRHPPELVQAYEWELIAPGRVRRIGECQTPEQRSIILLEQERDGIHSIVAADDGVHQRTAADCLTLRRSHADRSIVFTRIRWYTGFRGVSRTPSRTNTSSWP